MKLKKEHWLLILMSLFLTITHIWWVLSDSRPPSWDASVHLNLASTYWHIFKHFNLNSFKEIIAVSSYYPPLYHLTILPSFAIGGISLHSALFSNLFYLIILLWSTYGIGRILYNKSVGILAALLVAVYPFLIYMSRTLVIDLSLTTMVTLGFYLYLRSRDFSDRKFSLLFGLVSGLGLLMKWTYAFFLLGPILYGLWRRKKNCFISAIVALVVAFPWYSYNLIKFIRYSIRFSGIGASEGDPSIFTMKSIGYYGQNLLLQIQPVFLILFLVGLIVYMVTWKRQNKLLFWWMVLPYLILTLISNKDERYTLPILSAVAIISCFWLFNLKNMVMRRVLVTLIVIFGIGQFMLSSFSRHKNYYCQPPDSSNWRQKEVIDLIAENKFPGKNFVSVSVVANHSYWHSESLEFYASAHNLPIFFKGYSKNLGQFADYVITKTGDFGPPFSLGAMPEARDEILNHGSDFHKNFKLFATYILPDNSDLLVFKRFSRPQIVNLNQQLLVQKLTVALSEYLSNPTCLDIDIVAANQYEAQCGFYRRLIIKAKRAEIKRGIWLYDLKLTVNNIAIDLPRLLSRGKLVIFSIGEIKPEFVFHIQTLQALLETKKIVQPIIDIEDGKINLEGTFKNIPVEISFKILNEQNQLTARFSKLRIAMFGLPHWFYEGILEKPFSLEPTAQWPVHTWVNQLILENDKLIVK